MSYSKQIYTLMNLAGIKRQDHREELILDASDNRTVHTSELRDNEARELVKKLQGYGDANNKMRRKIIHLAHLLGWKDKNGKADMNAIDTWCQDYGMYHKPLMHHNHDELIKLTSQFEKAFKTYLERV